MVWVSLGQNPFVRRILSVAVGLRPNAVGVFVGVRVSEKYPPFFMSTLAPMRELGGTPSLSLCKSKLWYVYKYLCYFVRRGV